MEGAVIEFIKFTNGIEIAFDDRGEGEPLILLHGFCGTSAYWERIVPELESKYRIITPDLRGHGQSSIPDEMYSMDLIAEDIMGLMDVLELPKVSLFGHSLGGYAALAFAEKYPDRLERVALIHSTGFPDTEEAMAKRLKDIADINREGMYPYIEGLIPKLFAPEHLVTMPEQVEAAKQIGRTTTAKGAIHTLQGMRCRPDRREVLSTIEVPVLLVAGSEDQVIPAEKALIVEGPQITRVKLEGMGHLSMIESPEELTIVIRNFLEKT
ncbi:MAG TPA: alpha/beta hydrolase [Bacilli bacterium]